MKTILLIEDDQDIKENVTELLQLASYAVMSASNGIEALAVLKNSTPDLILCDIMMPELDGYGFLEIVNQNPETAKIPFIFMTAKSDNCEIRKGMSLGATDYITKPFTGTELLDSIECRLHRSEKMKTFYDQLDHGSGNQFSASDDASFLAYISKDRKTKTFERKTEIFKQDSAAHSLYLILSGRVKCIKTDSNGKSIVNEICGPGTFIGYLTLLEDGIYYETAITMEDTEVVIIPKQDFADLILSNRKVAGQFIKLLAKDVQDREKRLLKIAYAPVRERVASALLSLHNNQIKKTENAEIKITREELASIVGTAKESLIRMLSEIKNDKLIETQGNVIRILNENGLKKLAGN